MTTANNHHIKTAAKKRRPKTAAKKHLATAAAGRHHPDGPRRHPNERDFDLSFLCLDNPGPEELARRLSPLLAKVIKASNKKQAAVKAGYTNITYCSH